MMFKLGSFNLINEFERASNESNAEQLASSLAQLQPYVDPTKATKLVKFTRESGTEPENRFESNTTKSLEILQIPQDSMGETQRSYSHFSLSMISSSLDQYFKNRIGD